MDLTPYIDNLRQELAIAAETGGPDARALAERLTAPLTSAIRLTLLNALSTAADEITRDLAPGSVEVRLRAGDPTFAVTPPATTTVMTPDQTAAEPVIEPVLDEDGAVARINLRLPENLKTRVEDAAAKEGRSVNAWLVRAAATALHTPTPTPNPPTGGRTSQHFTGWVN